MIVILATVSLTQSLHLNHFQSTCRGKAALTVEDPNYSLISVCARNNQYLENIDIGFVNIHTGKIR
jgi:hypothetical protein